MSSFMLYSFHAFHQLKQCKTTRRGRDHTMAHPRPTVTHYTRGFATKSTGRGGCGGRVVWCQDERLRVPGCARVLFGLYSRGLGAGVSMSLPHYGSHDALFTQSHWLFLKGVIKVMVRSCRKALHALFYKHQ